MSKSVLLIFFSRSFIVSGLTFRSLIHFEFIFLFIYFFCGTRASHCCGLSRCGAQAPDAQAQRPWLTGPAAPQHVGSSRTGARTRVPCIGRRTLNHCATREALNSVFYMVNSKTQIKVNERKRCTMKTLIKRKLGASLVAQCLRVCLPTQGTRVRAPVREDPTCRGAAGPVSHGR